MKKQSKLNPRALTLLKRKLGNRVLTSEKECYKASFDGMKLSFMPEAVVRVNRPEKIGEMLKLANKHFVPVTTGGGGRHLHRLRHL